MKRIWTVITIMLLAGAPLTAVQASKQVQIDASMLVTGTVTISTKGLVAGYKLDHPDKLPKVVVRLLSRYIPRFRFKPVMRHGKAVAGVASMTLRLVAKPTGKGQYRISVAGFQFGSTNTADTLREDHMPPAVYPVKERRDLVGGIVYLFLQVNRKGRVMHAYAQQVNLTEMARDPHFISQDSMQRWRRDLARAAVRQARKWTFKIPKKGPQASKPYWYARIPAGFVLINNMGRPLIHHEYGQWTLYVPGPRRPIPWLTNKLLTSGSVDAQVPGSLFTIQQQLQLADQTKKG